MSAALESFIELIVREVVASPQIIDEVTEAVIDNPGFIAPTATIAKLDQRDRTGKRLRIEVPCQQNIKAAMKLDHTASPSRRKIQKTPPTDMFDDIELSPRAFSNVASHSITDH